MSKLNDLPLFSGEESVTLSGTVERIIFHNEENGYTVLRLLPVRQGSTTPRGVGGTGGTGGKHAVTRQGRQARQAPQDGITCTGHLLNPQVGIQLKITGHFVSNPRFGRQLAMDSAEEVMPATLEGIRLYLASDLIKGIGEAMATTIVQTFGTETIRILDEDPDQLLKVKGIGRKTLSRIKESWSDHMGMRELMLYLQPHGVSAALAVRVYKTYGADALGIIQENPYRMAMEIRGIGFVTADAVANKLGFAHDHPLRIEAATLYQLQKASEEGHVYLPAQELIPRTAEQLQVDDAAVLAAIERLVGQDRLVTEQRQLPSEDDEAPQVESGIYLARFYHCESKIAHYLQRILRSPKSVYFDKLEEDLREVVGKLGMDLAPEQAEALRMAATSKVMVLTGGPGTGKTTIINAIIKLFERKKARILLASPTGRAAKRMTETCGREARTIHRLLEYSPREDGFARNENSPLACGLLVVDEASMMDTLLFYHLLKAVPLGCTVILVGDVHQLPSVGPGTVLADIINSGVVSVVRLTEIFRQSAESEIICNAHLINRGEIPRLESRKERLSDFYFIHQDDAEKAAELIMDLVKNHIPRRFGLDPVNDIQVLVPMRKGAVGAESLNLHLQEALNPHGLEVRRGERVFRLNDKVMQIRNNYDKDIFNGDMGRITHIDREERTLSVTIDDRVVPFAFDELDELVPAYAISIHKSQGSEYPAVVIPLMMQHYVLLQRNLVYTGVTRGKKLVVLVGEAKALAMAIRNNKTRKRWTRLAWRLAPDDTF